MSDWTEGYVTDIGYTYGYYHELNPERARLSFLQRGLVFPKVEYACELGFGQGMSVNIHAAASPAKWYGTDFMPEQAAFARKLASVSQNGAQLFADSFEAFAQHKDLPDFDFIGLHGIWSWINNGNRRVIVNFLKKKLKPGGVIFISYNTLPGCSDFLPIRHLMTKYFIGTTTGSARDRVRQIQDTVNFMTYFLSTKPAILEANPKLADRIRQLHTGDVRYLTHEYLNQNWCPMYFADIGEWLQEAQLEYACSAQDCIHHFSLTDEQRRFLEKLADPMLKQSIADFITNRQFRVDYWVKGKKELNRKEQNSALRSQSYILCAKPSNIVRKVGKYELDSEIYTPVFELMSDFQPKTLNEMEQVLAGKGLKYPQIQQAVLILVEAGQAVILQEESAVEQAKVRTGHLNAFLCELSQKSSQISWLASPITGGGIYVGTITQLFLNHLAQGNKSPAELAAYAWGQLVATGRKVLKDGTPLETKEESLVALTQLADEFTQQRLPVLKALGIA